LFNLKEGKFTHDLSMNCHRFTVCRDYGCHSSSATFCQALHLNEGLSSLRAKFSQLDEPVKTAIQQVLAPLSEEDFLRDKNLLTPAILNILKIKWNSLNPDRQEKVFKKIGELASYQRNTIFYGRATAGANIIAHIDALELVENSSSTGCEGCKIS
jgi:hypothetical protein